MLSFPQDISCRKTNLAFDVSDSVKPGSSVASIQQMPSQCWRMCCTMADDYYIDFGEDTLQEDRALLLAFVFFLDFGYFSHNGNGGE